MDEEKSVAASAFSKVEEELEFRPWVKWCGLGVAGLVSVGFFLATYYIGYGQGEDAGFAKAIASGQVEQQLNDAASRNVLSFMRLASASEEELKKASSDLNAAFGWIKETDVRLEAEWSLADALLERGLTDVAVAVLNPLFEKAPHSIEWAYRMLQAGNVLASAQKYDIAASYYNRAADCFAENKQEGWRLEALSQLIALASCSPQGGAETIATLENLLSKLTNSDEGTRQLRSMALVHIGQQYTCAGKHAEAAQKYSLALKEAENLRMVRPEGAVSRGTALLALGDAAAAEPMLRMAEKNPGNNLSDVASRLLALRQLAVIEQQRGHNVTALALLHRAQGMAEGRVLAGNPFWPCLYDQRGWMHYVVQNFQTALLDFKAAMATTQDPQLLMQPQEGAARCYLELGKGAEAQPLLEQCLALRRQHTPDASVAIGRLNLLLAQIYDQQGKVPEAEAAYAIAVQKIPADVPEEQNNRLTALLGHAYTLTELQRWAEAYNAWETTLPLVEDQYDRREEVRNQMRHIKPLIPAGAPAQ